MALLRLACLGLLLWQATACSGAMPIKLALSITPVTPATPAAPSPSLAPGTDCAAASDVAWQVAALLVAPDEGGRLYALLQDSPGPMWAFPAAGVRLLVSDDNAATWLPFAGGLPVPAACMVNVNLGYAAHDALYASTCQGLYAWERDAAAWVQRSDQLTDVVAVAAEDGVTLWAAAHGDGIIRSSDGGRTWQDAGTGLITFGGMANLAAAPGDAATLYGIIQPRYAGSYLRRGTAAGEWVTLPTPQGNAAIATGLTLDGGGSLYVTTQLAPASLWRSRNAQAPDVANVRWERVRDFAPDVQVSLLAADPGLRGPVLYANLWSMTPIAEGGAAVGSPMFHRSPDGEQTWEWLATPCSVEP
jgi:hypothetical protein